VLVVTGVVVGWVWTGGVCTGCV